MPTYLPTTWQRPPGGVRSRETSRRLKAERENTFAPPEEVKNDDDLRRLKGLAQARILSILTILGSPTQGSNTLRA